MRYVLLAALGALALATASSTWPASGAFPDAQDALASATPEARTAFERLAKAAGDGAPITSFRLQADVLTRSGVQTNEMHVEYRYLAPDCIRFMLPSRNETGRFGPAPEQYWLKSSAEVVVLAGREYKEDRRLVDDMAVLARNYTALSSPGRLRLTALELLPAAPADLGPELTKKTRKLKWLALTSPDFALVRRDGQTDPAAASAGAGGDPRLFRVEVGLGEDALPAVAVIREVGKGGDPLLVEFGQYKETAKRRIPLQLRVHVLDRALEPDAFAPAPSQEIYVTEAELEAALTVEDFKPKPAKKP